MTLVKHTPANSIFDDFFAGFPVNWGRDFNGNNFSVPATNVHETKDAFHIELNAPGRNKEDFTIKIDHGVLSISYEKKEQTEQKDYKTLRREFNYKSFTRSFNLDDKVNAAGIQAKYENGVLSLLLPKKEEVKAAATTISIQ